MLPGQLDGLHASVIPAQQANNPILGKTTLEHHSSSSDERTNGMLFGGGGHPTHYI